MIENLAFSGGGIKCYAYIGVLKYLEEKNLLKNVGRFSCTSGGSIFCILILCGYNSDELENIVYNLDFSYIENVDVNNLFNNYGLDDMKGLSSLIKILLSKKNVDKNITFKELYRLTNKTLYITCTNLKDYSQVIFSNEDTPNMKIVEACMYSCSIPFIFSVDKEKMYVDGCFSKNLPIELLPVENTVGFSLSHAKSCKEITKFNEYVYRVVTSMMHKASSFEIEAYSSRGYKLVNIESFTSAINVFISKEDIKNQIMSGYNSISSSI